jgi:hypothetical protein
MIPLGVCPICGFDRMIMVSYENCRFDACPKCGFGYGYTSKCAGRKKLRNQELWGRIVAEQPVFSMDEETLTREKILDSVSTRDPADVAKQRQRRGTESLFKYSDKQIFENSLKLGVNSHQAMEAAIRLCKISVDQKFNLLNPKAEVSNQ